MNVVGQIPCGPSVCYDIDGTGVFILGGCHHSHTHPLTYSAPRFWILFFFCTLSCPATLICVIRYNTLFSSLNMVLWHSSVSCRKGPDLCSKHCAQTLQSYGCNICIPDLWFKGKKKNVHTVFHRTLPSRSADLRQSGPHYPKASNFWVVWLPEPCSRRRSLV